MGALFLLWNEEINLEILQYSSHHIQEKITMWYEEGTQTEWYLIGVYGHPEANLCEKVWNIIRFVRHRETLLWLLMGDFNEILQLSEKRCGRNRPKRQMGNFHEVLEVCELKDLGFSGCPFTWCNNRDGEQRILERLDRLLANSKWCFLFPKFSIQHGQAPYSDHCPIWMNTEGFTPIRSGPKPFRFEAMWVGEEECENIIKQVWHQGYYDGSVDVSMRHISGCSSRLIGTSCFGHVRQKLVEAKRKLYQMQERRHEIISEEEIRGARKEVHVWMERDELM